MSSDGVGGITVGTGFNINSELGIDANARFQTMSDALAYAWKKVGYPIYIIDEDKHYYWDGTKYVDFGAGPGGPAPVVKAVEIIAVDKVARTATVQLYDSAGVLTATTLTGVKIVGDVDLDSLIDSLHGLIDDLTKAIG